MGDDTQKPTPADMPSKAKEDRDQTWTAHVVDGQVKARVKSEDWPTYARKNGL